MRHAFNIYGISTILQLQIWGVDDDLLMVTVFTTSGRSELNTYKALNLACSRTVGTSVKQKIPTAKSQVRHDSFPVSTFSSFHKQLNENLLPLLFPFKELISFHRHEGFPYEFVPSLLFNFEINF